MNKSLAPPLRRPARHRNAIEGALLAAAAMPWMLVQRHSLVPTAVAWVVAMVSSLAYVVAGSSLTRLPRLGQRAAVLAIVGTVLLASTPLLASPLLALSTLVLVATVLAIVRRAASVAAQHVADSFVRHRSGRGAAFVSLGLWVAMHLAGGPRSQLDALLIALSLSVPVMLAVVSLRTEGRSRRAPITAAAIALQAALVGLSLWHLVPWPLLSTLVVAPAAVLLLPSAHPDDDRDGFFDAMAGHPERLFVGTFAALSAAGTLLLLLPQSAAGGRDISIIDALFTSVSAVCVTGLATLDTPHHLSRLGQLFVLLLIQVGGLGIMTFSTAALRVFGGRMSLRHESAVASLSGDRDRRRLYGGAQRILAFTLAIESVGAAWLTVAFHARGDSWVHALWRGVFTSVSAFCNAGFALQTDSLIAYQRDPAILHMVGLLIVLGGLSPAAVLAVPALTRRVSTPVALQIKLSWVATLALLGVGFTALLAFEWNHSLASLSWLDRVHNAWFQSITLRTAGFNSVDLTLIQPATLSLMLVWMFIGGSPGGTAGGIKTTTAAILVLAVAHAMTGRWSVSAFGRRVADQSVRKAAVVMTLAFGTVMFAVIALQLTQHMPIEVGVFEVVSALGTVGLSIGGTAALDGVGKLIVIACMFIGRVGGLSMLMFLSHRRPHARDGYLEQDVDVG